MSHQPRVHAYAATSTTTIDGDNTLIAFDAEGYDTDDMHSSTTNTSRIMFTTAGANEADAQIVMPTSTYANPSSMRVGP